MGNQVDYKFTWIIKDFSSLDSEFIYSDPFVFGGGKWRLMAYPRGSELDGSLSLYLEVADSKTLPFGWKRHTRCSLTVVNQLCDIGSLQREFQKWFDENSVRWGLTSMLTRSKLCAEDGGFLVNKEVMIVSEVEVLEVIGRFYVTEEPQEVTQPLKKVKREDGVESQEPLKEIIDINGFQVLPSQVDFVKRIFEKHPDVAVGFRSKNSHLRKSCMNSLLCLIDTLCQSPQDLYYEDLVVAHNVLTYLREAGFKVDWLGEKLHHVYEKKRNEQKSENRMRELEKELKKLKQRSSEVEALVEKEKANVFAARASLTFDDIIMT